MRYTTAPFGTTSRAARPPGAAILAAENPGASAEVARERCDCRRGETGLVPVRGMVDSGDDVGARKYRLAGAACDLEAQPVHGRRLLRSEEHTSELQSQSR